MRLMTWRAIFGRPYQLGHVDGGRRGGGGGHGVAAQVEVESKTSKQINTSLCQALKSWRFQRLFHRVNLHRPTTAAAFSVSSSAAAAVPAARGLHSSSFQLNLSRFLHQIHPKHTLIPPNHPYTTPKRPLYAPLIPPKALTLS
jgi:hypothetical protein